MEEQTMTQAEKTQKELALMKDHAENHDRPKLDAECVLTELNLISHDLH